MHGIYVYSFHFFKCLTWLVRSSGTLKKSGQESWWPLSSCVCRQLNVVMLPVVTQLSCVQNEDSLFHIPQIRIHKHHTNRRAAIYIHVYRRRALFLHRVKATDYSYRSTIVMEETPQYANLSNFVSTPISSQTLPRPMVKSLSFANKSRWMTCV